MLVKCKICGKEFEVESKRGRVPQYCSDKCRRKAHTKVTTRNLTNRYRTDDEFRKKRVAANVLGNRRRREARREQAMQELISDIMQANTSDEVRAILEKKTRIKSEYYA